MLMEEDDLKRSVLVNNVEGGIHACATDMDSL